MDSFDPKPDQYFSLRATPDRVPEHYTAETIAIQFFFCFAPAFNECIDAFVIQDYTYSAITHKPNGLHVVCRRTQIDVDDDSQQ